jgi:hypothetical protein
MNWGAPSTNTRSNINRWRSNLNANINKVDKILGHLKNSSPINKANYARALNILVGKINQETRKLNTSLSQKKRWYTTKTNFPYYGYTPTLRRARTNIIARSLIENPNSIIKRNMASKFIPGAVKYKINWRTGRAVNVRTGQPLTRPQPAPVRPLVPARPPVLSRAPTPLRSLPPSRASTPARSFASSGYAPSRSYPQPLKVSRQLFPF